MEADAPIAHFVSPGAVSTESIFDEYALNPRFQQLQTELRSWLFVGAHSQDQTRENSPSPGLTDNDNQQEEQQQQQQQHQHHHHHHHQPSPGHQSLWEYVRNSADQIPVARKVRYLQAWITDCAPWLDMFDQERHFGIQVPILSQSSAAVFHAMLAVAARTTERQGGGNPAKGKGKDGGSARNDSLELYSQAISALTSSLSLSTTTRDKEKEATPTVMVTACLLCVLEMMSVSPRDWRRHLEGCAALFASLGINGFSGGLLQAVFWCYARMDLCGAIIADGVEATVLPIEKWVLLDAAATPTTTTPAAPAPAGTDTGIMEEFLNKGNQVADMYANLSVYLCAKVSDLLSRRTRCIEFGERNGCEGEAFSLEWNRLWADLQTWSLRRPVEMMPIRSSGSTTDDLFPSILFAHWAAISSNQLYHTACILMLEIKDSEEADAESRSRRNEDLQIYSALWHARRVVGISLTNLHGGCLNNAIQPLYVAGKLFTHREEQSIIVNLIDSIEARTGWGSRWRIKDLEEVWGYRRGTFAAHSGQYK